MCGLFIQIELNSLFQQGKKGCLLQKGYLSFTITLGILKKMVRILLWGSVCAVLASVQRDKAKLKNAPQRLTRGTVLDALK